MTFDGFKHYITNPNRIYAFFASRGMLNFIPDEKYLKLAYRLTTGKKLDLNNPKTFSEKMQWMKLNCRNPLLTQLVDKYEVRKYIAENLGTEYLIPLCGGPWEKAEDIDFDALPQKFVLKCTHNSGGLSICRNKSDFDFDAAKRKLKQTLSKQYYWGGREWPYKYVKPRIIAEEYMDDANPDEEGYGGGLTDFKFFVFSGKPQLLYISKGLEHHPTAHISFYDLEGNEMPFKRRDFKGFDKKPSLPENMPQMADVAKKLAAGIPTPFVRIDLYSIKNKIYFSEITFFPCGGAIPFDPPEWDEILGNWINLNER